MQNCDPVARLNDYCATRGRRNPRYRESYTITGARVICGPYLPTHRRADYFGRVRSQCSHYALVEVSWESDQRQIQGTRVIHCGFFPTADGGYWKCIGWRDTANVSQAVRNREVSWKLWEELPVGFPTEGLPTKVNEYGDLLYLA